MINSTLIRFLTILLLGCNTAAFSQLFLQELAGTSDEGLYRFFNNILQLEHHRVYAANCWYIDYPWLAQNITDIPTGELLFEFDEIDRDEPLYFRIKKP